MNRLSPTLAALAAAVLLLAGCGNGDAQRGKPDSPTADSSNPRIETLLVPSPLVRPETVEFGHPPSCGCRGVHELRMNVLLPRGYDARKSYPVLYLLHGAGDSYDTWLTRPTNANGGLGGDVARIARNFPGVIVMPEGGSFGWYTNWWNGGRAGDPSWESYYLDRIIPLVERQLPIRSGRRWHAIAGWSMGGTGALLLAAQRPDYFGWAASLSGRIDIQEPEFQRTLPADDQRRTSIWGNPKAQSFYWTGHNPRALTDNLRQTFLFVRVGDADTSGTPSARDSDEAVTEGQLFTEARLFIAAAKASGATVDFQVAHRRLHNAVNEREGLREVLRRLTFAPAPSEPRQWTYRTVSRSGKAWGVRFEFARQPTSVITIARDGRNLEVTGSGSVRLALPDGQMVAARLPLLRAGAFARRR